MLLPIWLVPVFIGMAEQKKVKSGQQFEESEAVSDFHKIFNSD